MQSTFAERQFEFVDFVSYIVLLYFMLRSTLSVKNRFSLFYQLIECWSSFAISWCRWNWSHDEDYILRLVDLLCHITKNPNSNCKRVSGFQNLFKKCCSLHQIFSHKKSRLYQPNLNNNAEMRAQTTTTRAAGIPFGPVHRINGTSFHFSLYRFLFAFLKVSKVFWSDVWFRFNKF